MKRSTLLYEGHSVDCIKCGRKIALSTRTHIVTGSISNRFIEKDLLFASYGNGITLWVWVLGYWLDKPWDRASIPEKGSTVVAFAKLRKAMISFVISACLPVCPSVRLHKQLGSPRTDLRKIYYLSIITAVLYKTYEQLW